MKISHNRYIGRGVVYEHDDLGTVQIIYTLLRGRFQHAHYTPKGADKPFCLYSIEQVYAVLRGEWPWRAKHTPNGVVYDPLAKPGDALYYDESRT